MTKCPYCGHTPKPGRPFVDHDGLKFHIACYPYWLKHEEARAAKRKKKAEFEELLMKSSLGDVVRFREERERAKANIEPPHKLSIPRAKDIAPEKAGTAELMRARFGKA